MIHRPFVTSPKAAPCLGWGQSISDTRCLSRTPGCTRQRIQLFCSHSNIFKQQNNRDGVRYQTPVLTNVCIYTIISVHGDNNIFPSVASIDLPQSKCSGFPVPLIDVLKAHFSRRHRYTGVSHHLHPNKNGNNSCEAVLYYDTHRWQIWYL